MNSVAEKTVVTDAYSDRLLVVFFVVVIVAVVVVVVVVVDVVMVSASLDQKVAMLRPSRLNHLRDTSVRKVER